MGKVLSIEQKALKEKVECEKLSTKFNGVKYDYVFSFKDGSAVYVHEKNMKLFIKNLKLYHDFYENYKPADITKLLSIINEHCAKSEKFWWSTQKAYNIVDSYEFSLLASKDKREWMKDTYSNKHKFIISQ